MTNTNYFLLRFRLHFLLVIHFTTSLHRLNHAVFLTYNVVSYTCVITAQCANKQNRLCRL